jgi:hypothetical protein
VAAVVGRSAGHSELRQATRSSAAGRRPQWRLAGGGAGNVDRRQSSAAETVRFALAIGGSLGLLVLLTPSESDVRECTGAAAFRVLLFILFRQLRVDQWGLALLYSAFIGRSRECL